jgi:hypothetical protein
MPPFPNLCEKLLDNIRSRAFIAEQLIAPPEHHRRIARIELFRI